MSIREELELDLSQAESGIDRVGAILSQTAQTFKQELAEALDVLNVPIGVDTSQAQADIAALGDETEVVDVDVVVNDDEVAVTQDEIANLDGETATVDVATDDAELAETAAEFEALDGETIELGVSVDTGGIEAARDDLDQVGASANGAAEGLGAAAQSGAGFEGILAGVSAKSPPAVAGIAALVLGGFALADSAAEAEGSLSSFNTRTGEMAEEVRLVNVGGLNEDLGTLAIRLGSSDEGLQDAIASIFQLGVNSGRSGPEVAVVTDQIAALAANAVALNPQLGEVGDVAQSLATRLARGGRSLSAYGISLSIAEIEARALELGLADSAAELTQFDKTTAGASLAAEQFGDSIRTNVDLGAENAGIRLRSLREQLGEAFETAGADITVPLFDTLEAALPIIADLLVIVASLFEALAPVLELVFDVAKPLLDLFAEGLPLAIGAVVDTVKLLGEVLDNAFFGIDEAIGGLLGGLTDGLGDTTYANFELADSAEVARTQMGGEADSIEEVADALATANDNFATYLTTQSRFAQSDEVITQLAGLNIPLDDLQEQLAGSTVGFNEFVASAIEAGGVVLEIDGAEQTAADVRALDDDLGGLLSTGDAVATSGEDLVAAFSQEQRALELAAQRTLELLLITGELTPEQNAAATAIANTTDGAGSYQEVLKLVTEDMDLVNAAVDGNTAALEGEDEAARGTTRSFEDLAVTTLENVAAHERLVAETEAAIESLSTLGDTTASEVEAATQALEDLNEDGTISLFEFTQSVEDELSRQAAFIGNIRELQARGASDLALAFLEAGSEASNAAAEAVQLSDANLASLEQQVEDQRTQGDLLVVEMAITRAEVIAEADGTREDVEAALRQTDLAAALDDPFLAARIHALEEGGFIGSSIVDGVVITLEKKESALEAAGRRMGDKISKGFREILDIFSPSGVFEELGGSVIDGLAVGLDSTAAVGAMEDVAFELTRVPLDVTAGLSTSGATSTVGDVIFQVDVTLTSGEDPEAVGKKIVKGAEPELRAIVKGA